MNEKTKPKKETLKKTAENVKNDTWESEQNERKYYYDDSYGYKIYNEEDTENESESDLPETS